MPFQSGENCGCGMGNVQSRAQQFVNDVKAGMGDSALQQKYELSKDKFLFYKAAALDYISLQRKSGPGPKRKLNAHQVLADIKAGMDDDSLMAKYELNARQLQSVFRQMIRAGLATAMELSSRLSITKSQVQEAFVEMGKAVRELD